jgi:hypothetical protein
MAGKSQTLAKSKQAEIDSELSRLLRERLTGATQESAAAPLQVTEEGITPVPQEPTVAASPEVGYVGEFNVPKLGPETLELQQQIREQPPSMQNLYDVGDFDARGFMGSTDIMNIWGPVSGPEVIDSLVKVKDNSDNLYTARTNGDPEFEADLALLEAGSIDNLKSPQENEASLDVDNKVKLDQQSLFIGPLGFNASVRTSDARSYRIDPDYMITAFSVIEPMLAQTGTLIPQNVVDSLSKEDVKDLGLQQEIEESQAQTIESMGRSIQKMWYATRGAREGGEFTRPSLENMPKLTQEAYSLAGLHAMQMYAQANPEILKAVPYDTDNDFYQLTPYGQEKIKERAARLKLPTFKIKPLVGTPSSRGQPRQGSQAFAKETTGRQLKTGIKHQNKIYEAMSYYANVRHVVGGMRGKLAFAFGLKAIQEATKARVMGGNSHFTYAADFFDIGQDRINKINRIPVEAQFKLDEVIKQIQSSLPGSPRAEFLANKAEALRDLISESSKESWQQSMYQRHATRQLEMLNDLAVHKDQQISFTFSRQLANTRLTMQQQVMNPQAHKIARNVLGSSSLYTIKPGVNSKEHTAMLVSFGATLFNQALFVPEQSASRMKARIADFKNDPELRIVEHAGKELATVMLGFNPDSTVSRLSQLEANENGIFGVNELVTVPEADALNEALGGLSGTTLAFLNKAKEHPAEFISIIEHAMEFARYMDAKNNNKSFTSQMRPVEVDGISNGLAAIVTQLGLQDPMYRVGVLQDDPDKVLSDYLGIEGDLRDLLKANILSNANNYLENESFKRMHNIADSEDAGLIMEAIKLAADDKKNFLKPPMMTLPYGQSLSAMKGQAYKTIAESKRLTQIADQLGTDMLAGALHHVLTGELTNTLGKDVVDYIQTLQDYIEMSAIVNEPIVYTNALGIKSSINEREYSYESIKEIPTRIRAKGESGSFIETSEKSPGVSGLESQRKKLTTMVRQVISMVKAKGGIPGGATRGAGGPQVVIQLDGATMVNIVTGEVISKLRKENGGRDPYILPIFDAVVTDLGSFLSVTKGINDVWLKMHKEYDLLGELEKGFKTTELVGLAKMKKAAQDNPKAAMSDRNHAEYLWGLITQMAADPEKSTEKYGSRITGRAEKFVESVRKSLPKGGDPVAKITNANAYSFSKMFFETSYSNKIKSKFSIIAKNAKQRREKLLKDLKGIHQYSTDNVKMDYEGIPLP